MKNTGEIIMEIQGDIREMLQPFSSLISEIEGKNDPTVIGEQIELAKERLKDLSNYACNPLVNNNELVRAEVKRLTDIHNLNMKNVHLRYKEECDKNGMKLIELK